LKVTDEATAHTSRTPNTLASDIAPIRRSTPRATHRVEDRTAPVKAACRAGPPEVEEPGQPTSRPAAQWHPVLYGPAGSGWFGSSRKDTWGLITPDFTGNADPPRSLAAGLIHHSSNHAETPRPISGLHVPHGTAPGGPLQQSGIIEHRHTAKARRPPQ
jgi:hypothetical protein